MSEGNPNLARIQRISRRIQRILIVAMALPPLVLVCYWIFYNDLPPEIQAGPRLNILIVGPVPAISRLAASGITLAAASIGVWGLYTLLRLSRLYESGRIFVAANVACFRMIGRVFIAHAFASVLMTPLLSVVLSWHNPAGQKQLALSVGSGAFYALLAGCIVLVIAAVMEEGRKLEDERRLTI